MASRVGNRLLRSLPTTELEQMLAVLNPVKAAAGALIAESGQPLSNVYFPVDCCFSLLVSEPPSASLGLIMAGPEGMVGESVALGATLVPLRVEVQTAGTALRMDAAAFREQLSRCPTLRRNVNFYIHTETQLLGQAALCAQHHLMEPRLATWMLMANDRAPQQLILATHQSLSRRLGVRRSGITGAAGILQKHGLIEYRRGRIEVLDRGGLERLACPCYPRIRAIYASLPGGRP